MMKKISAILIMIFLVGCTATLGANEMPDEKLEAVEEQVREVSRADIVRKEWTISYSRNSGRYNMNYILGGPFVSASSDVDLQTIKRFVFTYGDLDSGNSFVFDSINQRIYYDTSIATFMLGLQSMSYYSNIEDGDFDRLIQVIEESNLRNWEEFYQGEGNVRSRENRTFWQVGILFNDGTILRRGGSGRVHARDFYPPRREFRALTSFIDTLGAEVQEREYVITDERLAEIKVEEQRIRERTIEHSRNGGRYNLNYIVSGNFVSASNDVDFQTIERFVFSYGGGFTGNGFVFDNINEKIYYGSSRIFATQLDSMPFYANIEDGDFNRLIKALEKSNLRNWDEYYQGTFDRNANGGGMSWQIGILFSDGTMMRRGGSGDPGFGGRDFYPPEGAFDIITSFINTLGAEVRERHNS